MPLGRLVWARQDDYHWRAGPYWVARNGEGRTANYCAYYVPRDRGQSMEARAEYYRTRTLLGFRASREGAMRLCETHERDTRQAERTPDGLAEARAALRGGGAAPG